MSYDYDRRQAARRTRKPLKLTDDEKKVLIEVLGRKLAGTNFNTIKLEDVKPNIVKSLHKKDIIFAQYQIRFTSQGYDITEKLS